MVPTPVGNLSDISARAIDVLKRVDIILCEDTRTSSILMRKYDICTPLASHHKFNEHSTTSTYVDKIESGLNIAMVSDAGTPGISDPGFMLSRECRKRGVPVVTLPGPTAFVPALVNSGLPCERFCFEGFLPPKKGRSTRINEIASEERTSIIYESPLRLVKTLSQLLDACGEDRAVAICREISKLHEHTFRGSICEAVDYFTLNPPKGEIVIVLGGYECTGKRIHVNKYKN